jgi:IS5 family transposase
MLRERALGETIWESVLPAELRELPLELARVDAILEQERFLAPFRRRLTARGGRPTIPIETYLRLMYLKYRYGIGYETLCKEVADSFTWRRFCRIGVDGRVPDPTTLMKLTRRLGPGLVEELNAEVLSFAVERRLLRSRRLRVDTTLLESDTRYPTDSGLCAHAVSRLTRLAKRLTGVGLAGGACVRDRRRSVGKRVRAISSALARGGRSRATVDRLTGEIHARAQQTVREARALLDTARRFTSGSGRPAPSLVDTLERELAAAEEVIAQTALRLAGQTTIPDRRVSLVDADARPIRRGNPRERTEFGYKALVTDTSEGFVIVDVPERGNPPDDTLLDGAIAKAKASGIRCAPSTPTAASAPAPPTPPSPARASQTPSSPANRPRPPPSTAVASDAATASETAARAASPTSNAKGSPARACEASTVRKPGQEASPSHTTSTEQHSSADPDQAKARPTMPKPSTEIRLIDTHTFFRGK